MMSATPTRQTSGAGDVPAVGPEAVDDHAPERASRRRRRRRRREDPAEVGVRLEGGDEAVEAERDDPRTDPEPSRGARARPAR